jgi:uncharacterized repeat protein (TIGR03806 family)
VGPYLDGKVRPSSFPSLLSQTGAFRDVRTLDPHPALLPFDLNTPLWSDGAVKTRWLAVPNDGAPYGPAERIGFAPTGEWTFPEGTVFVKTFELPLDDTNPGVRRRLETRLLIRDATGGVTGVTYKWRADQAEADLLPDGGPDEGLTEEFDIRTATGTRRQTWYYPSRADCLRCHNPTANFVLGVKTRQINRSYRYSSTGIADTQLRTWNHLELFDPPLAEADIPLLPRLAPIGDASATLEHRVRSYIDANCAGCHRPGLFTHGTFDERFDTPLSEQGIIDGFVFNSVGIPNGRVVVPGDVSRSVMHRRISVVGSPDQMPPLARNTVDAEAVALLEAWIAALAPSGGGGSGGCGATGVEALLVLLLPALFRNTLAAARSRHRSRARMRSSSEPSGARAIRRR